MTWSHPPAARQRAVRPVAALALAGLFAASVATAGAQSAAAVGPEQVTNGTFADGMTGWTSYPSPSINAGRGCIDVPAGNGAYSAAITQKPIPMANGTSYTLSFTASVTPAQSGGIRAVIQNGPPNYEQALPEKALALTTTQAPFSYTFTSAYDIPKAELAFQQTSTNTAAYQLCIDDVSLIGGVAPPVYTPNTGPRVRVNQVGYLPHSPKSATLVTTATQPLPWELHSATGAVLATGQTVPRGVDPTAGANAATIDFSSYTDDSTGLTIVADGETSHPFDVSPAAYQRLRSDSKTVFYTNRSGIAISDAIVPGYGRAAGHVGIAPNQGDTAVPCQDLGDDSQKLYDQPWTCDYTSDVTGGWYDAGDQGKYVVNGGIAVTQLMQEYERNLYARSANSDALADGTLSVPESKNGVPDLLDEARWELEWMLKMQVRPGRPLAGMAFHKVADVDWTGLPTAPAADPQRRVLYRPSTAATLNLAASAAQGARLFARYDKAFASKLLTAARTAYAAAAANPNLYAPMGNGAIDPNAGSGAMDDTNATDERYWAAVELFLTTREPAFRDDVLNSPFNGPDVFTPGGFQWQYVAPLGRLDLATVPNRIPGRDAIRRSVLAAADSYLADQAAQPFGQAYAPPEGNYVWGSNSQILNNMQVLGTAYDISGKTKYSDGVLRSMDYIFGRNALNISYVTGYGTVFSQNQHSRMYTHQIDPSLPHPPVGTLAGGPNSTTATTGDPVSTPLFKNGCPAQRCYIDDIGSWSTNELDINWNASLSWVSSFIADLGDGQG